MSTVRERSIRVALSDQELEMVHALADADGTNVTELLRRYIRKAYAKKIGAPPKRAGR